MVEILTGQYTAQILPQFLELRISYSADGYSVSKPGMVLSHEKNDHLLRYAVFNPPSEDAPPLCRQAAVDITPCDNYLPWGWATIAGLSHSSIAVIDFLSCPAILQAIIKFLRRNNNHLFVNVPHTYIQYAEELPPEYRKFISFVPDFSDIAREHAFTGVVALGTIAALREWFKYNIIRCQHFATLIV